MRLLQREKLTLAAVDTWAAALEDRPGSLASKLKALAEAGANLEFVFARRAPEMPGAGIVFVAPIATVPEIHAAHEAGFLRTGHLHTLRVEGEDKPGQGARIVQALADKSINLRGLSATVINRKFVAYAAFDSPADLKLATEALQFV